MGYASFCVYQLSNIVLDCSRNGVCVMKNEQSKLVLHRCWIFRRI